MNGRMVDHLARLSECVNELAAPYLHAASHHIWSGRNRLNRVHITRQPSLIGQLRALVDPANRTTEAVEAVARLAPGSRPAANLHAVDLLAAIAAGALAWLTYAGTPARASLEANVFALTGLATGVDDDNLAALARDVASWHRRARVACGWQPPAYAPDAPCLACDAAPMPGSGLRIRDDGQAAWCLTCGAAWDEATIGLIAAHLAPAEAAP